MERFVPERVESPRIAEYLEALSRALEHSSETSTKGRAVHPRALRLRPDRRNGRVLEVQLLFELDGVDGCVFGLRLGPGPAHAHEDPKDWVSLVAIGHMEALATKKRLPKDCAAAADAEGITWF